MVRERSTSVLTGRALRGIAARAAAALVAPVLMIIAGCASSSDTAKMLNPDPPAKMYADADKLMSTGYYSDAAKKFEDLDRDHPYSPEARRAIVMSAYAYYKGGKMPEAVAAAERYTTLHPGTKDACLAHHIIAQAHFEEIKTPNRDQGETRKALTELKTLRARYPDCNLAKDADNRVRVAEDTLAASEMEVGRYYQKRNNYIAAINRYKTVVTDHQTTVHVEEALYRLVECYMSLGIKNEAQNAGAILGHNFPNSKWYKDAYALLQSDGLGPADSGDSWLSKAWKNVPSMPKLSLGGGNG